MRRRPGRLLVALLALAGCLREHPPGAVELTRDDCYSCHRADYEAAIAPRHINAFPTTCGDCHGTDDWHETVLRRVPDAGPPADAGTSQLTSSTPSITTTTSAPGPTP
jgi:hypothetical protein